MVHCRGHARERPRCRSIGNLADKRVAISVHEATHRASPSRLHRDHCGRLLGRSICRARARACCRVMGRRTNARAAIVRLLQPPTANQPWHPGNLSGVCHERPFTYVVRTHHVLMGVIPSLSPGFALMPALRGACKHSPAIQILPTRTEVRSFGRGRIGVRHEKLSDRDRRCSFPGEHGDGGQVRRSTPGALPPRRGDRMRRRDLLSLALAVMLISRGRAQAPKPQLATLSPSSQTASAARWGAFWEGMQLFA